jgi:ribosomal protein S27AE
MGSCLIVRTYPDSEKEILESYVEEDYNEDKNDDGSLYSGSWGALNRGVDFQSQVFCSVNEAGKYINIHHRKPDMVLAVKAKSTMKASQVTAINLAAHINQLTTALQIDFPAKVLQRIKSGKSKTKSCKSCGMRHEVNAIESLDCGKCGSQDWLLTAADLKSISKSKDIIAKERGRLAKARFKAGNDVKNGTGRNKKVEVWVVGGNCPY